MENKRTIFDYLEQIFCIFGMTIIMLNIFCLVFGDGAKGVSSIFDLGSEGLTINTMCQFFMSSVLIVIARYICFSDKIFKNISIIFRTALMLFTIIIIIVLFVLLFEWFPINMWQPWVMFFISFAISFGVSVLVVYLKEKMENKKMEEALKNLKKGMK